MSAGMNQILKLLSPALASFASGVLTLFSAEFVYILVSISSSWERGKTLLFFTPFYEISYSLLGIFGLAFFIIGFIDLAVLIVRRLTVGQFSE